MVWIPSPKGLQKRFSSTQRPMIYYAWHGDSWWLIAAVMMLPPELRPVGICNSGTMSRLNSRASAWLGVDMFEYSLKSERSARRQITDFVKTSGRHIMVFPDAGGPYRQLRPGILSIALEAEADLLPVGLKVRPKIVIGRIMQHRVPFPFSRVEVFWAQPFSGRDATTRNANRALQELGVTRH